MKTLLENGNGPPGDGVYARAYPVYDKRGWPNSLKLRRGTKYPPPAGFTGHGGETPSTEQKAQWALQEPDGNIVQRLGEVEVDGCRWLLVGIDVDHWKPKTGGDTLTEGEKRWGKLPPTYVSTSRDDGVSGILIYRVPVGTKLRGVLQFPELKLGDVEIIQFCHRYITCWPSIHPDTGDIYLWYAPDKTVMDGPPYVRDIPELPAAWIAGLQEQTTKRKSKKKKEISAGQAWPEIPYIVERALSAGEEDEKVRARLGDACAACFGPSRHDLTRDHVLALARLGMEGHPGVFSAMETLSHTFISAVTADGSRTEQVAQAEFMRFLTNPRFAELLSDPSIYSVDSTATPQHPRSTAMPGVACCADILGEVVKRMRRLGLVGEERLAKTVYLALTSRLLDQQVSIGVKGHSASGKSHTVAKVLRFFPEEAYLEFTAMSARALVYSPETYSHRTLVVFEVTALREGVEDDMTSYLVRSLLSEGRIVYQVTIRDPKTGTFTTHTVTKEGPTNLVFTTTKTQVHAENETRVLSLNTDDSANQTKRVFDELADERLRAVEDLEQWRDLQRWLADAEHRVTVPYAKQLVGLIRPAAVRMRRDVGSLLALIRAHAVLHQASRERDPHGRIIATLDDYMVVRDLVSDVMAEGVGATVPETVRQTVEAVGVLNSAQLFGVTVNAVADKLGLDKSNASRRLRMAADGGYLRNREDKRGKPARWEIGDPLPETVALLPEQEQLGVAPLRTVAEGSATVKTASEQGEHGEYCGVAPESQGYIDSGVDGVEVDEAVALVETMLGARIMCDNAQSESERVTSVTPEAPSDQRLSANVTLGTAVTHKNGHASLGGRGALTATAYRLTDGVASKPDAYDMRQKLGVVSRRTPNQRERSPRRPEVTDHYFSQLRTLEDRLRARMVAAEGVRPPADEDGEDG